MNKQFSKRNERNLLMDGAMGTELIRRGLDLSLPLWSGDINVTHPLEVSQVHEDYLSAGADIITTNTFRTTPRTYIHAGYSKREAKLRARKSMIAAVEIAKNSADKKCVIAGSIAPLEDCYSPELYPGNKVAMAEYAELVEWLVSAGVDIILFETMGCWDEIKTAMETASDIKIPLWLSLILRDEKTLLDGSDLGEILLKLKNYRTEIVLLNCNMISVTKGGSNLMKEYWNGSWGVYPNVGKIFPSKTGHIHSKVDVNEFVSEMHQMIEMGAQVVGACCGSTPDYIRELRKCVDDFSGNKS